MAGHGAWSQDTNLGIVTDGEPQASGQEEDWGEGGPQQGAHYQERPLHHIQHLHHRNEM